MIKETVIYRERERKREREKEREKSESLITVHKLETITQISIRSFFSKDQLRIKKIHGLFGALHYISYILTI